VVYRPRVPTLVLITGTSSGIGRSAAVECAARGHRVVATMRDVNRRGALEAAVTARGVSVNIEQLDITADGVGAKVRELILKYGPFFAVVNNAGIAIGGAFEEQSEADIREQFETNVFGAMNVTRALLPSMRAAGRGRIINISSTSGRVASPLLSLYAATKHAIEGWSEGLRWEVEGFGINVCLVEPGVFKTPIFFENQRRGRNVTREGPYAALTTLVEKVIVDGAERAPPPDAVGRVIADLVGDASPKFRSVVGTDARALMAMRRVMSDDLYTGVLRRLIGLPRPR
jgi:NAD(P)-dependent dehydrogenase (short-subunit alcohol dehydrogenase family)